MTIFYCIQLSDLLAGGGGGGGEDEEERRGRTGGGGGGEGEGRRKKGKKKENSPASWLVSWLRGSVRSRDTHVRVNTYQTQPSAQQEGKRAWLGAFRAEEAMALCQVPSVSFSSLSPLARPPAHVSWLHFPLSSEGHFSSGQTHVPLGP